MRDGYLKFYFSELFIRKIKNKINSFNYLQLFSKLIQSNENQLKYLQLEINGQNH